MPPSQQLVSARLILQEHGEVLVGEIARRDSKRGRSGCGEHQKMQEAGGSWSGGEPTIWDGSEALKKNGVCCNSQSATQMHQMSSCMNRGEKKALEYQES